MKTISYALVFLFPFCLHAQIEDTTLARQYLDSCEVYYRSGDIAGAQSFGEKALNIYQTAFGETDSLTARALHLLGIVELQKRDLQKSMEISQKVLDIRLNLLGENHRETAETYSFIGVLYMYFGDYKNALDYSHNALDVLQKVLGLDHPELFKSYNRLGNIYIQLNQLKKALEFEEKGMLLLLKLEGENHKNLHYSYNNIGRIYNGLGKNRDAIEYHEKALKHQLKTLGETHPQIPITYDYLGSAYRGLMDFSKALDYHQKALNVGLKIYGENHDNPAYTYISIGRCLYENGERVRAIETFQKALDIFLRIFGKDHLNVAITYTNIGRSYIDYDNQMALDYYQKALDIDRNVYGDTHPIVASIYHDISGIYSKEGQYDKAAAIRKKELDICLNSYGEVHPYTADCYYNIGVSLRKKENYQKALENQQKAFEIREKVFGKEHPDVIASRMEVALLLYLTYAYRDAKEMYESALSAFKEMKKKYADETVDQFLAGSFDYNIYEHTIIFNFEANKAEPKAYDLNKSFQYAEESKSNQLLRAVNKARARSFAGIPEELLRKEYDIKTDLAFYDKKRFEEVSQGESKNDSLINEYNSQIFDLKKQLNAFVKQLEKDYPEYYELKYKSEVVSVAQVQSELLEADQALLEYFVGDSSIFVFIITPNNYKVHDLKRDFPLLDWVTQMRNGLYQYHLSGKDDEASYRAYSDTFAMASHKLYEKMVAPFEKDLPEKLIIVPDGVLSYIPFEVLLKQKPNENHQFKNHAYFIKDHQISYGYSATFLLELKHKKTKASKGLLAFAPSFELDDQLLANVETRRNELGPLQFSVPEVEGIQALLGGEIYLGESATEENFTQLAEDYNILHLATHGKANDRAGDYSYLAFTKIEDSLENEFLYVRDLYNMKLNADMVVLSACETGLGELQRGEGVVSLARGFSYAGAKSIITTLWSVSDENTKDLMLPFYENIKSGMEKDAALRQAKLDYIEQNSHLEAHPFYWAGLIPLGNMEPVSSGASFGGWMGYGLLALGAVLVLFWLFRRNQNA